MSELEITETIKKLQFDREGLIPAIVQDATTGRVLTLAYMNRETVQQSLKERETYFWSRSRQTVWHKGETSGNTQQIQQVQTDCDSDALLIFVNPQGPACHTGKQSCFFNQILPEVHTAEERASVAKGFETVEKLIRVIKSRKAEMPEGSYTTYLFSSGLDKILKKIGEECAETIIAAKNKSKSELTLESADLLYHLLVLFVNEGVELDEVLSELEKRLQRKKVTQPNAQGLADT
jgi:phosphoribosyl-ATP pyrophosphohydrolase/phosphoribosyl-AMP cyclohydrolase